MGDWILIAGVGAAIVTAIATAGSFYLLWRQDRRSAVFDQPIIETTEPKREGETSVFTLTIRNTQPATLVVLSIAVRRPRKFNIYAGEGTRNGGAVVGYPLPEQARYRFGSAGWPVGPSGCFRTVVSKGDTLKVRVAVLPPAGWSAGSVTFVLRMRLSSVKSRAIKMAFRKLIQHEASTARAAKAKSKN